MWQGEVAVEKLCAEAARICWHVLRASTVRQIPVAELQEPVEMHGEEAGD